MATDIRETGNVYYGYRTTVWIAGKYYLSTKQGVDMVFNVNSTDTGDPGTSSVTFYNISPSHINDWHVGNHISVWTGPPSLFGKEGGGTIKKISQAPGDQDKSVTIYFDEAAVDADKGKLQDSKTTTAKSGKNKGKKTVTKVNHTFPKNVKAKTIIDYILKKAKIHVGLEKLKTNKQYKRGYTLSKAPFQALESLAADCGSKFYFRNDQLIFDDGKKENPFKEHIYLSIGSGLTAQPVKTSTSKRTTGKGKQKKTVVTTLWTLECWDDPRVNAGTYAQVGSKTLTGFVRVKSVKHQLSDDGYTMEVQVYGQNQK